MTRAKSLSLLAIVVVAMAGSETSRAQAQSTADSPVATVQRLYRDYAWELLFWPLPRKWPGLTEEPRAVLNKYFDDRLASLMVRDRECVALSRGECNIDGSPIWASNDPAAHDLEVVATKDPTVVQVSFTTSSPTPNPAKVTLLYRMSRTSRGWRISDIINGSYSLVALLQRK